MITNALLFIIFLVVTTITSPLRLLADVALDSEFAISIATASTFLSAINAFLPMTTLFTIVGIFITFETLFFTYKLLMWVIKKIPTVN